MGAEVVAALGVARCRTARCRSQKVLHQPDVYKRQALVRVLPVEGEGGLFLYVGVYIYIRYIMLRQLIREGLGVLQMCIRDREMAARIFS